jgi:hypothetical protein
MLSKILQFCFCFIFILFPYNKANSQTMNNDKNIIGCWQAGDSLVASGLKDVYRFYKDNSFIFEVSSYNHLSKLISISGTYKVESNILYLIITNVKEKYGGELIMGDNENDDYNWTYVNYKAKVIKINNSKKIPVNIEFKRSNYQTIINLKFNFIPYYKLNNNPDFEKKQQ